MIAKLEIAKYKQIKTDEENISFKLDGNIKTAPVFILPHPGSLSKQYVGCIART